MEIANTCCRRLASVCSLKNCVSTFFSSVKNDLVCKFLGLCPTLFKALGKTLLICSFLGLSPTLSRPFTRPSTIQYHHRASLLKSSIKQAVCGPPQYSSDTLADATRLCTWHFVLWLATALVQSSQPVPFSTSWSDF